VVGAGLQVTARLDVEIEPAVAGAIRTSLMRRRKWPTFRPDAKRAAPPVGSVWLEPAT
jgi:hypothetical protein